MTHNSAKKPLTEKAIAAAKPKTSEYTLWDGALAHFGVRVQPSGVRSFIVQVRVQGRMRKFIREGGGQALTGARAGRAIEHRESYGPGCRGPFQSRRQ